jgi:peptide/nickel transport system permease protein
VKRDTARATAPAEAEDLSPGRRMRLLALQSPWLRLGGAVFGLLVLLACFYPSFGPADGMAMDVSNRLLPPAGLEGGAWLHPLGTDQLGRDLLARSLVGMRYSLLIGVSAMLLTFVIGSAIGIFAGFKAGWAGLLLMRLADAQLSIPAVVLAVTVLGVARPSVPLIVLVLALAGWPMYARVTRSVALAERNRESVRAARVLGASDLRIMFTLIVPVVLPPVAFVALLDLARLMIFEALLSFIGLGLQPPLPSFGNIIADGRKYLLNAWWVATVPGALLVLLLLSVNMMGTALERAQGRVFGGVR